MSDYNHDAYDYTKSTTPSGRKRYPLSAEELAEAQEALRYPRREIDVDQFTALCRIQCTEEEIAGVLQVSPQRLTEWCLERFGTGFVEIFKQLASTGKASLRRNLFQQSEKNVIAAIWLSKQHLGMTDRIETTSTNLTVVTTASRADVNAMTPTEIQERIQALLGGAVPSGQIVEEPD